MACSKASPGFYALTGETIPLSDSDEELDSDTESLDGVHREADMFLLNKAVSQHGAGPKVVRVAANMLKAKRGTQTHKHMHTF